jgi:hypothetical protein
MLHCIHLSFENRTIPGINPVIQFFEHSVSPVSDTELVKPDPQLKALVYWIDRVNPYNRQTGFE